MKRFGKALKASLKVVLIGAIFLIAGIVLITVAEKEVLNYVGYGCVFISVITLFMIGVTFTSTMDQYCPACQKKYGDGGDCTYSFVCNEYKENYDSQGNHRGTTYYFSISITCPHCDTLTVISYKTAAKSLGMAEQNCNKYILNNVLKSSKTKKK